MTLQMHPFPLSLKLLSMVSNYSMFLHGNNKHFNTEVYNIYIANYSVHGTLHCSGQEANGTSFRVSSLTRLAEQTAAAATTTANDFSRQQQSLMIKKPGEKQRLPKEMLV